MASKANKTAHLAQLEFDFSPAGPVVPAAVSPAKPLIPAAGADVSGHLEGDGVPIQDRAEQLHAELTESTGIPIRLRVTNNSSTMMSLRYDASGTVARVGLHHMFLDAPADIRKALADWICKPRAKAPGRTLEGYIAGQRHRIKPRPPRRIILRTEGLFHDLATLYGEVNARHFNAAVTAPITWGKMPSLRKRRSIRFGSYSPSEDLIRIHPLLDQEFVPGYFVRYIVFHEMLHADMGIGEAPNGRRKIHPPEFRTREMAYPDYDRAIAWMNDERNLRRLLRAPKP